MNIFFSVGEPSGDLHASNLIRRLKETDPKINCIGFGGPKMKAAGCELLFDLTSKAIMFFWDAIKNYFFFRKLARQAEEYFRQQQVDAVVLIDYPGFNWWIAKAAKRNGVPVYYYGVPQMWAWAPWRIRKIRKFVDHILCKLPFEEKWFQARGCKATFVGHPYFDQLTSQELDRQVVTANSSAAHNGEPLLVLLPGSRDKEVERHLPILLDTAEKIQVKQSTRFAIACYNERQRERTLEIMAEHGVTTDNIPVHVGSTPELMVASTACLACSGSVSLELMYYRKPTVIVYRVGGLIYFLQSIFLRTKYITLVNLMAAESIEDDRWQTFDPDRPGAEDVPMPEYLTKGDPSDALANRVCRLLGSPTELERYENWLDALSKDYAIPGATGRAAEYIFETLKETGKASAVETNTVVAASQEKAA